MIVGICKVDKVYAEENFKFDCDYYKKEATLTWINPKMEIVNIPSAYDGCTVTRIERGIISEGNHMKRLFIPNSVVEIEDGCAVGYPSEMGVFNECYNLTTVVFEEGSKLKRIPSYIFSECYFLENIQLPEGVEEIGEGSFAECHSLLNIEFPSSIKKIEDSAFMDCKNLNSIRLDDELNTIGEKAFVNTAIISIVLPTKLESIGSGVFMNCENLISVRGKLKQIPDNIFKGCLSLEECQLSETLNLIGEAAFEKTGIKEIIIPRSVNQICVKAFSDCDKLEDVYFQGEPEFIDENVFNKGAKVTLHGVSDGTVNFCAAECGLRFEPYNRVEGVKIVKQKGNLINISWESVDGVENYDILRCDIMDGKYQLLDSISDTSFVDDNIAYGKTYLYVISIDQNVNNVEIKGIRSKEVKINIPNVKIKIVASKDKSNSKVSLSWNKISGVKEYKVYRGSNSGTAKLLAKVKTNKYVDKSIKRGITYKYYVVVDKTTGYNGHSSVKSNQVKVKTTKAKVTVGKDNITISVYEEKKVRVNYLSNGTLRCYAKDDNILRCGWDGKWFSENGVSYTYLYIYGIEKGTTYITIKDSKSNDICKINVKIK